MEIRKFFGDRYSFAKRGFFISIVGLFAYIF